MLVRRALLAGVEEAPSSQSLQGIVSCGRLSSIPIHKRVQDCSPTRVFHSVEMFSLLPFQSLCQGRGLADHRIELIGLLTGPALTLNE